MSQQSWTDIGKAYAVARANALLSHEIFVKIHEIFQASETSSKIAPYEACLNIDQVQILISHGEFDDDVPESESQNYARGIIDGIVEVWDTNVD
ncbi:hypothetical protein [Acaryochloris sp. IP29b_bin.137]|uniref:hypothetical protein n=1 Tax=Acaryochloris sp. IP29b_bin.137 TaxID=2969217 RepID=UPI00261D7F15|nr:hypothetical protein [Acaryochloris sp. IP29b_bin.137]